ncbi:MAG: PLD nuclease N-terminal domain-containing protein [Nanoarchaeota archaeon]|nr:PLD nuclease N-terminal domain-containing protein [Nanoarchaeota archaeon]MBU1103326.1 PLD nuclease N-terminal domain-containing protein [Nanoarchaeota archaeon]
MATELAPVLIFIFLFLIIFALAILVFIFWIWMLVDCAKRNFKNDNDKIIWILVIVLAGIIGAIIYYFVVKHEDKKPVRKK